MWSMLNCQNVRTAQEEFEDIPKGMVVGINCIYYFDKSRVLTKDGRSKRLDCDNRLKCLLDKVTELVGFDDSLIWEGSFSKRVTNQEPRCDVEIVKMIPKLDQARENRF